MTQDIQKNRYWSLVDQKLDFRKRLFLSFFIIALPILLIVAIGSYLLLSTNARSETEKTLMTTMERLKNQLEHVIVETQNLSKNIIYNEDVQALLEQNMKGEKYPSTTEVAYFINSFIVNREYIESVVILGQEESLFSTERAFTNVSSIEQIRQKWWYPLMIDENRPYVWYQQALDTDTPEKTIQNTLMLTRPIRSLADYKTSSGRMMIYLKESYLNQLVESIDRSDTTNYWVLNESGQVMLHNHYGQDYSFLTNQILDVDGTGTISIDGKKYLIGNETFTDDGWRLLVAVPLSEVDSSASMVRFQIITIILIVLLVIVLVALFTATTMARPIKILANTMDAYHGHTEQHIEPSLTAYNNRKDEVGIIYQSYQKLVNRIETLIKEIYIKDLEKKDAELALLETQINPHFLYNTLDSINWMAMENEQDEISEMVTALSDTFRLSLTKNSSSFVQLGQEIEYIRGYMTIQKFRYGDRLHCNYDIDENTRAVQVLRFLLQPVVENSLKHGIDKFEAGGNINIITRIEDEALTITVINDGAYIDLHKMEKTLAFDVDNTEYLSFESEGYGMQNINRRIKIVHGTDYGVHYEITQDTRTACIITLPIANALYGN